MSKRSRKRRLKGPNWHGLKFIIADLCLAIRIDSFFDTPVGI